MKSYRFLLEPLSPWCTPWQADTIFGSLCWELRKLEGEDALKRFLQRFQSSEPAFVLSDALPEGWFPRPLFTRLHQLPKLNFKPKMPDWLSEEHFRALLTQPGGVLPQPSWPEPVLSTRELHAAIDRFSGTTGEGGNLFEIEEWALDPAATPASRRLALYVRTQDSLELAATLLQSLSASGFGKKKTIGRGAFRIIGEPQQCGWMDETPGANGFVSLSHFVPRAGDPTDGAWQLLTKYPKYGQAAPAAGPFKGRLTLLKPGSTFRVAGSVRPFYGRMLTQLQNGYPDPVHYALAFPVPIRLPADISFNADNGDFRNGVKVIP